MIDSQFDDFFNDKLKDHEAPVPSGLWDKLKDTQFDSFIGNSFKDHIAPVPTGLWEKITDGQFDEFVSGKLFNNTAPLPAGLWDKITDGQFDQFVSDKLLNTTAAVPAGLWDKVTDGQFDQFVAGKLIDHVAPVPVGLWDKVKPVEEEDRKIGYLFRRPAAAMLFIAMLFSGSLGGYLFLQRGNGKAVSEIKVPTAAKSSNDQTASGNQTDASIVPAVIEKNSTAADPPSLNNPGIAKNRSIPPTSNAGNNYLRKEDEQNLTTSNITVIGKKQGNTISMDQKMSPADKKDQTNTADNNFEFIEPYQSNLLSAAPIPFGMQKGNTGINFSDKKLSTVNHTSQFKNVIICPSDQKNHNTEWFLEPYSSVDIPFLSVNNGSASAKYMLTKDSSESSQVSYSGGLRLVKPLNENLLLKLGVHYSQINQKYVYRTENEVKTTTVVTVRTIIRAPGDTVIVNDTSTLQQIGFKNNTVKNRYRTLDIPLTVGYQFGSEDLKFGVNAGVIVNVSSWYQGVMLDSTLATVPIDKTGNGQYKTNIGLGLYGSINVVKKLSDDMQVFVEPYFRYNLNNMTNSQAKYSQKFNVAGVSVGLRINLNRQ